MLFRSRWLGLDHLGVLQVLGHLALGLISLFSFSDHITVFGGRTLQDQQQRGNRFDRWLAGDS